MQHRMVFSFFLDCLTLEDGTDKLSENYHSMLCKIPNEDRAHFLIPFSKIGK
jgi:hypothetical protein